MYEISTENERYVVKITVITEDEQPIIYIYTKISVVDNLNRAIPSK